MKRRNLDVGVAILATIPKQGTQRKPVAQAQAGNQAVYEVDRAWPKMLLNNWASDPRSVSHGSARSRLARTSRPGRPGSKVHEPDDTPAPAPRRAARGAAAAAAGQDAALG